MPETTPLAPSERIDLVDVIRGMAIGGILIGNMQWFSGYGFVPAFVAHEAGMANRITQFLVHFLVEGKFYSIFSFLFGFGFALQIVRAEERGDLGAILFKRRIFWLLVFGLLHAYLLWYGDILSIYAIVGFVLLLFRKRPDASILRWAAGLILFPIVWYTFVFLLFRTFVPPEAVADFETEQTRFWTDISSIASQGGYVEILTDFNLNVIAGRYLGLIFDMRLPKILAMFLLGVYAYRRGYVQNIEAHWPFIKRVAFYGLLIGLHGNLIFAAIAGKEAVMPPSISGIVGVVLYSFSVPALAVGLAASTAILFASPRWKVALKLLAPVGKMALTNYIGQSAVCVFIFYGFGLGYFGKIGALTATLIAVAIFLLQIALSLAWLKKFDYGPLEWIWRQLTYKKRIPLLRSEEPA